MLTRGLVTCPPAVTGPDFSFTRAPPRTHGRAGAGSKPPWGNKVAGNSSGVFSVPLCPSCTLGLRDRGTNHVPSVIHRDMLGREESLGHTGAEQRVPPPPQRADTGARTRSPLHRAVQLRWPQEAGGGWGRRCKVSMSVRRAHVSCGRGLPPSGRAHAVRPSGHSVARVRKERRGGGTPLLLNVPGGVFPN